jgi:hypothetical protein
MASFLIQIASFEFKQKTWINQMLPHRYEPPTPTAIGTDWAGPSAGGTNDPDGRYRSRPPTQLSQAIPTVAQLLPTPGRPALEPA